MNERDLHHAQKIIANAIQRHEDGSRVAHVRAVSAFPAEDHIATGVSSGWAPIPAGDYEAVLLLRPGLSREQALKCAKAIVRELVQGTDRGFDEAEDPERIISEALAIAAGYETPWLRPNPDIPF